MTGDMFPDTLNEDPNRRYTKPENVRWMEQQLRSRGWHLDPAADEKSHHAPRYFSVIPYATSAGVNGLEQSWLPVSRDLRCPVCLGSCSVAHPDGGGTACPACFENEVQGLAPRHCILLNPPWDDLEAWARKLWLALCEHFDARIPVLIAFVVPGDRHEQRWWQRYVEPYRFEKHRWQRALLAPDPDMVASRMPFLDLLDVRVHCPPERWEYNSPGGGSKNNAFFPSAVIEFRSRWP